jgi:hypothetical protein
MASKIGVGVALAGRLRFFPAAFLGVVVLVAVVVEVVVEVEVEVEEEVSDWVDAAAEVLRRLLLGASSSCRGPPGEKPDARVRRLGASSSIFGKIESNINKGIRVESEVQESKY